MPDKDDAPPGHTALLIIDMLNIFDFDGAGRTLRAADPVADTVLRLRDAADEAGVPVVYVNDNFDEWLSERADILARCTDSPGADIARRIAPRANDFFIVKPQLSGFYSTNLPVLLPKLGVTRLILTGIAADICVLFTAADAHMRDYALWVPADGVAGEDEARTRWALEVMENSFGAKTGTTQQLSLADWIAAAAE